MMALTLSTLPLDAAHVHTDSIQAIVLILSTVLWTTTMTVVIFSYFQFPEHHPFGFRRTSGGPAVLTFVSTHPDR